MNPTQSNDLACRADVVDVLPIVRPAVDIVEERDAFILTLELPGVREGDVEIRQERNRLSVQAERRRPATPEGARTVAEFGSVRYARDFHLPVDGSLAVERIGARLSSGLLEIRLPKAEAAQPRRIDVQSAG